MRIVVFHPQPDVAVEWLQALRSHLPQAVVYLHTDSDGDTADYGVGWLPPADFFAKHSQLRAFFCSGAGVERILADPNVPDSLPIVRIEDAGMGVQMADYCLFETLRWMLNRDAYDQQQRERSWHPLPVEDRSRWPIGVFGMGQLGSRIADAFCALKFPVNGYAREARQHPGTSTYGERGGAGNFTAFMQATRVLIICAPLTAATRNRFDRTALSMLPSESYVINVARGALLVEESLIELLDVGHLAGAALDVFREEPLARDSPLWIHPRIRITPHVSAVTLVGDSAKQIAGKIVKLERGEAVSGLALRERGY